MKTPTPDQYLIAELFVRGNSTEPGGVFNPCNQGPVIAKIAELVAALERPECPACEICIHKPIQGAE